MEAVLSWIINNWGAIAAGILVVLRFIESGLKTKKWDVISLVKEFFKLG